MAGSTSTRSRPSKAKESPAASPSPAPTKPKGKATAKATDNPPTIQLYRRFSKDTSGTYRFEAVDSKGSPLAQDDKAAHVTQLYVRKTSKAVSSDPKFLIVTIQEVDSLPKGAKPATTEDED